MIVAVSLCFAIILGGGPVTAESSPHASSGQSSPGDSSTAMTMTANTSENASLGASVSSFMQMSTEETNTAVDNGMWATAFNNAATPAKKVQLLQQRTNELERRLAQVKQERQEVLAEAEGNITVADRAKAARLIASANGLEQAIDQVTVASERANVDLSRLNEIHIAARNLTGPEIAAIAPGHTNTNRGASTDQPNHHGRKGNRTTGATDSPGKRAAEDENR